ncbi:MAG: dihydrodipicolinate synthase family protein [Pirellulaceae bacterium]
MSASNLPAPLRGIVPPMVTPLSDHDRLNVEGTERLIEHILAGGVHGLFILGTSGEAPSLSYRLRRELIQRTRQQVGSRVPVLVGITDTSVVETVNLACYAAEMGADAVVLSTPYYFPAGQTELLDYLRRLVPRLPLPLLLYNMPMMTKVPFEPETIRQILDLSGIVGLKDSSGDMDYFRRIREVTRDRPDWSLLVGPERLLGEAMRSGGTGGVSGGANLYPALFVALYEAAVAGDEKRVVELQQQVCSLGRIYRVGRHASAVIKGLKCALSLLGICDDVMAEPFHHFFPRERGKVEAILRDFNAGSSEERDQFFHEGLT